VAHYLTLKDRELPRKIKLFLEAKYSQKATSIVTMQHVCLKIKALKVKPSY
jgi:hypothetical protein